MKSFKKSILNVCTKLISTVPGKPEPVTTNLVLKRKSLLIASQNRPLVRRHRRNSISNSHLDMAPSPTISASTSSSPSSVPSPTSCNSYDVVINGPAATSSTSSGYGTSTTTTVESISVAPAVNPLAVFVNLDNYFFDENFSKYKDRAHESALEQKRQVVQCLLDYEVEYLGKMRSAIESIVRPLNLILEQAVFFDLFQNIEKICSITEFIKNSIDDSMLLTMDIYKSTITIIHEYISIIVSTYELYIRGFPKAMKIAEDKELFEQLATEFDPPGLIQLPIDNITKIYCAFSSLLDMTPLVDHDDYEKLSAICCQLKALISDSTSSVDELFSESDVSSSASEDDVCEITGNYDQIREVTVVKNNVPSRRLNDNRLVNQHKTKSSLPQDFTDYEGYKHYFV